MDAKFGLVLEGGGFRGCYTAGALKWLNDHDIHFPYVVTISVASAYGYLYLTGHDQENYELAVNAALDPDVAGIRPLFKEGGLLGVNYLLKAYFDRMYKETINQVKAGDSDIEIGLFNMDKSELQYFNKDCFTDDPLYVKASCVLPLSNRMTKINGDHFLDGGIKHMVSIQRSKDTGHTKHLVIVTKDKNYVRKPNGFFLNLLLHLVYHKYQGMLKTLDTRVETYYDEMNSIYKMEEEGSAILIRPSMDPGVKRFSGNRQQLEAMYQLGYQDMEDRKEELLKFLEVE